MIKYTSSKQISIDAFIHPFGGGLSQENRWVKLAKLLPWDEMTSVYAKNMAQKMGRKAINPRVAVGTLIIKHMLRTTDEETIELIKENPYLQYFLGFAMYRYQQPFTPSLLVSIRQRLGIAELEKLTTHFMTQVHKIEQQIAEKKKKDKDNSRRADTLPPSAPPSGGSGEIKPPAPDGKATNKGHLIVDATVAPSDIKYPTDLDLLNEAREKSEQLIDRLYEPKKGHLKPRTYREVARKEYLSVAKQRRKRKNIVRKAIRKQLGYVRRNLKIIARLLDEKGSPAFPLPPKNQRMYWVIQEVYRQQNQMYHEKTHQTSHRIVSIHQPYIRPIVRGKAGKATEFGAKISVSIVDGYSYLDRINWDAYNESEDLETQIEAYKNRFGCYPQWVSADQIYGTRANRAYMKERGIHYSGVALGRRLKKMSEARKDHEKERKRMARQRSIIEGRFGVGKRKYDLDLVKAKTKETSESWIGMIYLVMNIAHFMRVIFCPLLKVSCFLLEKLKKTDWNGLYFPKFGIDKYKLATF